MKKLTVESVLAKLKKLGWIVMGESNRDLYIFYHKNVDGSYGIASIQYKGPLDDKVEYAIIYTNADKTIRCESTFYDFIRALDEEENEKHLTDAEKMLDELGFIYQGYDENNRSFKYSFIYCDDKEFDSGLVFYEGTCDETSRVYIHNKLLNVDDIKAILARLEELKE